MRFKFFLFLLANAIMASIHLAYAQQSGKIPRIGYVSGTRDLSNPGANTEAFQQGLRAFGVINLKTAKQIGVTIPPNVLARADKVIR